MQCPSCKDSVLQMSERNGIEIDYCPNCRGVWLDRGELDKIIEKSAASQANHNPPPPSDRSSSYYDREKSGEYKYKRKKSFLEELFD